MTIFFNLYKVRLFLNVVVYRLRGIAYADVCKITVNPTLEQDKIVVKGTLVIVVCRKNLFE